MNADQAPTRSEYHAARDTSSPPAEATARPGRRLPNARPVAEDLLDGRRVWLGWWPPGHAFVLRADEVEVVLSPAQARRLAEAIDDALADQHAAIGRPKTNDETGGITR